MISDMLLKNTNNLLLVKIYRKLAPNILIVDTVDSTEQIESLKMNGANDVLLPYSWIGNTMARVILDMDCQGN